VGEAAMDEAPPVQPARAVRRKRPRLLEEAGPVLRRLAERAWAEEVDGEAARVLALLAPNTPGPEAALTALRRLGSGRSLANACRKPIASGALDVADLWTLSEIRPIRTALDGLTPSLRDRHDQLALLTTAGQLPSSLRKLVRMPQVAPAYSMNLVALRIRAAIGRFTLDGDPYVLRSVVRRPTVPMLCALTVHITCGADPTPDLVPLMKPRVVTVPGFPVSTLNDEDGPWRRAFPDARELGADTDVFWHRVADTGLMVPASWVARGGGWPVLWARAHSRAHR
jgi:hypothetical protein